jgi:hypothetical protein
MSHIRMLVCCVDDEVSEQLTELAAFDLPEPTPAACAAVTALDTLEATTLEIGHAVLRAALQASGHRSMLTRGYLLPRLPARMAPARRAWTNDRCQPAGHPPTPAPGAGPPGQRCPRPRTPRSSRTTASSLPAHCRSGAACSPRISCAGREEFISAVKWGPAGPHGLKIVE